MRQCDLQDMVLSVPRLKEFVGRNLLAKPNLLGEIVRHSSVPLHRQLLHICYTLQHMPHLYVVYIRPSDCRM